MFWAAAIPAVASLAGDLLGMKGQQDTNMANAEEARKNRLFQSQEASLNRQFQEQMSSTAYQRAVQDMKGAGLNPALAYQQGGASSPAGNAPSGAQATMQNKFAGAGGSARAAAQVYQDLQTAKASRDSINAVTAKTAAETETVRLENLHRAALLEAQIAELKDRSGMHQASAAETAQRRSRSIYDLEFEREARPFRLAQARAAAARDGASARALNAGAALDEASLPAAENVRRMSETWWGKYFVPYISSGGSAAKAIGTAIRALPK